MSVQGTVHQAVEAAHNAPATQRDQSDGALLAWVEADGRPRWNVEAKAPRGLAAEAQRAIDFEKMEVGADLDRSIAGVGDINIYSLAASIQGDLSLRRNDLAGRHGIGWGTVTRLGPSGKVGSVCDSGRVSGTPSVTSGPARSALPS